MELTVTRSDLSTYTIIIQKGELSQKLLSEDLVSITVTSSTPIDFALGDSITLFGSRYVLNRLPKVRKEGSYTYDLEFEGEMYALRRAQFLLYDDSGVAIEGEFSYMGTLEDVARLAIANLNRVYGSGTYTLGGFPETDVRNHIVNSENVLAVLQRVCNDYGYEFELIRSDGNIVLNIGAIGTIKLFALKYGAGNGLYTLERQLVDDSNVFTRLFAYGGTRNLKSNYRNFSKRLKLPGNDQSYVQDSDAISRLGIIEATKVFDDVYPKRTGVITSVSSTNSFVDSTMDFDLNATDVQGQTLYLIPGNAPKVHFNTGNLAGYEFEIASYNHANKTFTLKYYKDERGLQLPSNDVAFALSPGDEYVLLDIVMPQSYVDAAEAELLSKANELLTQGITPKAKYTCTIDPIYAKQNDLNLIPGDYIPIQDDDLGIDRDIRVISVKRDILEPYRLSIDLGDEVTVSLATYLVDRVATQEKVINLNQLKDPVRYRQSWRSTMELQQMVFDQDGYFDTGNIRPLSINTAMLSVGSKAGQFVLNGVVFQPGYNGVANRVQSTMGTLSHYAIEESIRTWVVESYDYLIPDNNARYIYIKCELNGSNATVKYSADQLKVDAEAGFYHFLIGVLHSVQDGYRKISLTYGVTTINGKEIKTGRISSQDGATYFDLDTGEIKGKITFQSGTTDTQIEQQISAAQSAADLLAVRTGAIMLNETFNETQAQFDARWTNYGGGGNRTITSKTDATGGNVLVIGDNSGDDKVTLVENNSMPYDPNRLYAIRVRFRRLAGSGTIYIGIAGRNATDTQWVNVSGANDLGSQYYVACSAFSPSDTSWVEKVGYFKGYGSIFNNANNPLNPSGLHSNVRYIRPYIIANYNGVSGIVEIDYVKIEFAEQDAAQASASNALTQLTNIASDNVLSPMEKQMTKMQWDAIVDEYAKIIVQADLYPLASTDKTNYTSAYNALSSYITPLLSNLSTDSSITGSEFRTKFSDYYSKRQTLLNRVTEEAQKLAKSGGSMINWQNLEYCNYPMTIASYQNFATYYYGNATENAIIHAETPYGTMDKVWECNCDAADNGYAGGFKTGYFPVNPSKNYIYGAWVKLLDSGNIYIYFGPDDGAGVVKELDGTDNSNPYFAAGLIQSYLPTNRWLLFIGVIHNKDYSASIYSANLTGVYDPLTLKKLPERSTGSMYKEFKWYGSPVTSTRLRLLRTYAGTAGTKMQIYGAFVYELSGTIPTVYDMLMTAVRIPPTARPSDSGTFAYYTFDKSLTSDDSFNGKTLSTSGTVSLVASDIKGKCAYFDNSGYLSRDDSAIKTDQMTYTFWFKWNGYISGKTIYGLFARAFYVRCYLYYTSNYVYLYYAVRNSAGTHVPLNAYRIEPSKWYHVAASYDKTTGDMKLYVNGSRVGVANSGAFTEHSNNMLTIGTDYNSASAYQFNGYIDEFRAYSRILSDDEVMYMYLNPTVGLDYGSLKTIIDGGLVSSGTIQVGQGNDGDYTVKAGITGEGTDETSVRMWAGATFANRNNAPFKVLQNGEMHASAGYIAGWKILTDRFEKENGLNKFIINPADQSIKFIYDGDDKVAIQNAALPMLSELVNPNANQFSLGIYQEVTDYVEVGQGLWEASGSILSSSSFAIPNSSYKVAIGFYISERMSIYGQLWLTDNAGTKIELIGSVSFSAGNEPYVTRYYISSPKSRVSGTYRVLFEYEINGNDNYELVTIGYGGTSNNYFSYTQALNGSIIGNNGITTFWGNSKYMHISNAESYFMQVFGNGILTGSGGSGIQFDGTDVRLFGIQHDNQYNYQYISSSHVVLNFNSKTIIVNFGSSSYYAILPTLSSIQTAMKLGAGVPFSFMYRIIGNASSVASRVYGRNTTTGHSTSQYPTLRNNSGADAVYVALGAGDTLILELVYDGTNYNAYMLSYRT